MGTHVLVSSNAAPKTLFDFDQVPQLGHPIRGQPSIWYAIFGARDGFVKVTATTYGEGPSFTDNRSEDPDGAPISGVAFVFAGGLICCSLVAFLSASRNFNVSTVFSSIRDGRMSVDSSVPAPFRQRV